MLYNDGIPGSPRFQPRMHMHIYVLLLPHMYKSARSISQVELNRAMDEENAKNNYRRRRLPSYKYYKSN